VADISRAFPNGESVCQRRGLPHWETLMDYIIRSCDFLKKWILDADVSRVYDFPEKESLMADISNEETHIWVDCPEKEILMDYVSRPKMMKISFVWRSKIAFLGNSKKGNFDGIM